MRSLPNSSAAEAVGMRTRAYGQGYQPTIVDRFGTWLSARQIRRWAGPLAHKALGDFGCGYHATISRTMLPELERAVLVDSALDPGLRTDAKVTAIEGLLPDVLE